MALSQLTQHRKEVKVVVSKKVAKVDEFSEKADKIKSLLEKTATLKTNFEETMNKAEQVFKLLLHWSLW